MNNNFSATKPFEQTEAILTGLNKFYHETGHVTSEMWDDFEYFVAKLKLALKVNNHE
jgi:hypothetical protein